MPSDFPPLSLANPQVHKRASEKGRRPPLPPDILARRAAIAERLGVSVTKLSRHLQSLTDDQRRAVFIKLTHDGPINLGGTGLRPILGRGDTRVTLAVPTGDTLESFAEKIRNFGVGKEKGGYVTFQDAARIREIVQGEPKDRLSDALFARYDALVEEPFLVFEVELASLAAHPKHRRDEIASHLEDLHRALTAAGKLYEHEELDGNCRAVVGCPGKTFQRLVEDPGWQTKIILFDARPQFETFHSVLTRFNVAELGPITPPPDDAPVICVIDSGVTRGNPFLEPVCRPELLRSFLNGTSDPSDEYGHGSGVASLAAYYLLDITEGAANSAHAWIAGARILGDNNEIEDERLFSRVLRDVVEWYAPRGVRIFVLSVADPSKPWAQSTRRTLSRKSWIAREIDRLSHDHDILFVTCTGNLTRDEIKDSIASGTVYPGYLANEDACILDPGQAALSLTVGSLAHSTKVTAGPAVAIAKQDHPSPFTRSGPGIRGEIKPELVDFGGNIVFDRILGAVRENKGTNIVVASNRLTPAIVLTYGVSFAAPRVAHKAARVLHELEALGVSVSAPLLKAFMVNSAQPALDDAAFALLRADIDVVKGGHVHHLMGYGVADVARAVEGDDYSATLFYQGEIEADYVAFFEIPVPSILSEAKGTKKRLTVTVSHYPEVQKWGLERYHGVDLKWRLFRGDTPQDEIIAAMGRDDASEEGEMPTDVAESPKELKGLLGVQARSRGTVQHDVFHWTHHLDSFSDNHYTLAVAAYKRWGRKVDPTPLAVVVRIEDLGHRVSVYQAVQTAVEVQTRAM